MFRIFQLNRYQENKRLVQSEAVNQPKTVITGEFDVSCTIMALKLTFKKVKLKLFFMLHLVMHILFFPQGYVKYQYCSKI
jgi:hypothetical protein